jgi:hypothetical protein
MNNKDHLVGQLTNSFSAANANSKNNSKKSRGRSNTKKRTSYSGAYLIIVIFGTPPYFLDLKKVRQKNA